jgi:putative PIN family toxin of toxin-antitoxin system
MASVTLKALVFDTNALIGAALLPRSTSANALVAALSSLEVFLSETTWTELQQMIARPKFSGYLTSEARHHFLQRITSVSRFVSVQAVVTDCVDPKDNPFLALALEVQATSTVSGDQHLLKLHPWCGVSIGTPAEFLLQNGSANATPL